MDPADLPRFEAALASGYDGLLALAARMKLEGARKQAVTDLFTGYMLHLRAQGREREDDLVADALDRIVGWGPNPLFPEEPYTP